MLSREFVEFLKRSGALRIGSFLLKSGRQSPVYLDVSRVNGPDLFTLAREMLRAVSEAVPVMPGQCVFLCGVSQRGIPLVAAMAAVSGVDGLPHARYFFFRDKAKDYRASGSSRVVGETLKDGDIVVLVDDVMTTGQSKEACLADLGSIGVRPRCVVIVLDRMEITVRGESAVDSFFHTHGIPVCSVVSMADLYADVSQSYVCIYGTQALKSVFDFPAGGLHQSVFSLVGSTVPDRFLVPALDALSLGEAVRLVIALRPLGVQVYKVGLGLIVRHGLPVVVEALREADPECRIVVDGQTWGNDVPHSATDLAEACYEAGVHAVILFPFSSVESLRAYVYAFLKRDVTVIFGGPMTCQGQTEDEGGFLPLPQLLRMVEIAARTGVNNFVVPTTKPDVFKLITEIVGRAGIQDVTYWGPGLVTQGGLVEEAVALAGPRFGAIVGRDITQAEDPALAASGILTALRA